MEWHQKYAVMSGLIDSRGRSQQGGLSGAIRQNETGSLDNIPPGRERHRMLHIAQASGNMRYIRDSDGHVDISIKCSEMTAWYRRTS